MDTERLERYLTRFCTLWLAIHLVWRHILPMNVPEWQSHEDSSVVCYKHKSSPTIVCIPKGRVTK